MRRKEKIMRADFLKDYDFFTGVPDSQLKPLCNYLINTYGISKKHIIAANEGNCTALAAGYYMATGKVPVVYLQNSGIGNIINPVASLLNDRVYAIPCIFVVGWRGEPGVHDEPQHIYQGEVTVKLLEDMDISVFVITKETTQDELDAEMKKFKKILEKGKSVAFVVKKGALEYDEKVTYENGRTMLREEIINHIADVTGEDVIVSTTGKASRELFEIREARGQSHKYDFLTVGSMGHASSIAMEIALQKDKTKVWCIDGDGAALMHMGAMALIGANSPHNMVHVVINNGAHETVGGMPTVASKVDMVKIAEGCGYKNAARAASFEELDRLLREAKERDELSFIEVECSVGSRENLGRPTVSARQNIKNFMEYLETLE